MNNKAKNIVLKLEELYPDATCFLNHETSFQLLIAVMLSAQTTDEHVNKVTPFLFQKYPNAYKLASAELEDVKNIIKSIGLFNTKAFNIIETSKEIVSKYNGEVPNSFTKLTKLKGVGRKTANVVLANCFAIATFAVDTHVNRVSKRLGIAKYQDDLLDVEFKLNKYFAKKYWIKLHHQFILFGRNICKSQNPKCLNCPFVRYCKKKLEE